MNKQDRMFVFHIRDELRFLDEITEDLTYEELISDKIKQHCIQKSLEIIGEASKNISDGLKLKCKNIPWREIAGMRDKLSHGYFDINWEIVWNVLKNELVALKNCIEKIAAEKYY